MQKYKFTCLHVELKSTALQCDPNPASPCSASLVSGLTAKPHTNYTSTAGSGPDAGCGDDCDLQLETLQDVVNF